MPNIFELCSKQRDLNKLQNIKDTFQKIQEDEKEALVATQERRR